MKFTGNYHAHTRASDGHAEISDYVPRAKELGLDAFAITDHSFFSAARHMTEEKFAAQERQIAALEGCGVKILHGVEGNILNGQGTLDVPDDIIRRCDILIAGYHRFVALSKIYDAREFIMVNGFGSRSMKNKLFDVNTEAFVKVIERYPVDVIAHIGHRTPLDFRQVGRAAKAQGVYIELNAKHIFDTAGIDDGMDALLDEGVNFIIGTDAHRVKKLGDFDGLKKFIKKHDIPADRIFGVDGNAPVFKDKSQWKPTV